MKNDCFPPSLLRYDDLSTHVVEEVAEVANVIETGEVKGEATRHSRRGMCRRRPLTCQEDHTAWCSSGAWKWLVDRASDLYREHGNPSSIMLHLHRLR